jgi:hypothetical protein
MKNETKEMIKNIGVVFGCITVYISIIAVWVAIWSSLFPSLVFPLTILSWIATVSVFYFCLRQCDIYRFKRFMANHKNEIPQSAQAYYCWFPTEAGEMIDFDKGVIQFQKEKLTCKSRMAFNSIQRSCKKSNPAFQEMICRISGEVPRNGIVL